MRKLDYNKVHLKAFILGITDFDVTIVKGRDELYIVGEVAVIAGIITAFNSLQSQTLTYQVSNDGLELTIFDRRV